ncbi:BatD family protein [Christiangramia flava]|uniref:BatD n=1 Tax=Christiangramia flava JLT2011 TaxID=1229726 RepID=A0A1L7I3Q9_9FLAO|nr:BatD family protein [Christiangramia flava]APU68249.1 BatD [Christiangramia flava JLT2011]OSS40964.1 BatD [Christiangramia flava JLT2011]
MKIKFLILSFLLFASGLLQAQVRFEAKVSRDQLGINERLRVDFEMNDDGDNFRPPSFEGFTVVGGPNQKVSQSFLNGKMSFSKTYSFYLQPKERGKLEIGQAEVEIENKIYKTSPIAVNVGAAVDKPTDGDNSEMIADSNLHLVAEVSKSNPYLNEAITVVYKLYVSPRISVSNWRELDSPKYADFWSQNIDQKMRVQDGEYMGEPYRYVILRKTILYPQKTGELNIEPLALSVAVDVPSNRRDIFGSRIYKTVNQTVAADNKKINVKALPDGKPANFTGAVGDFDFNVELSRNTLNAGESLQATVEVKGNGNLKLFDLPELTAPPSLEMYSPERKENVTTNLGGMQGSISEDYTVVPTKKGKYPIPALSFSWFDPQTGTYKTKTSEELLLNVENGPVAANSSSGISNPNKQAVAINDSQFRFIKLKTRLKPLENSQFLGSAGFWSALVLPLALIPLFIFFGKKREERARDVKGNRIRKADKLARKYLSEAKRNLGDQKEFYLALERSLHNYLKAKLRIQTSDMSKDRIEAILQERGVEHSTIQEFLSLLSSCEFARYTPASSDAMKQDYEKAAQVISTLDKQL